MKIAEQKIIKKMDMNLSDSYVPEWGTWEAYRELVSNAMDADPDYSVDVVDQDNVIISTKTIPRLSELKVMGLSKSREDEKKIGQFGEGFKLAALVFTRQGDRLELLTPEFKCSFCFEIDDLCESRTLHILVEHSNNELIGSKFFISSKGIGLNTGEKFLKSSNDQLIEKEISNLNVYYKGVWVAELEKKSLYDYSLSNFDLNRDRSVVNEWSFSYDAAAFLSSRMTESIARRIVNTEDSYEMELLKRFPSNIGSNARKLLSDAVANKYGEGFLVSTDDSESNMLATNRGKKVVRLPDGLAVVCDVTTTKQFLSESVGFNDVTERFIKEIDELNVFLELFSITPNIFVFENNPQTEAILGNADPGTNTVWLNESLFLPGNKKQRIGTFIHELAHLLSKADDGSVSFEACLSELLGELGFRYSELAG